MQAKRACAWACVRGRTFVCVFVYEGLRVCVCMSMREWVCVYMSMCVHVSVCVREERFGSAPPQGYHLERGAAFPPRVIHDL